MNETVLISKLQGLKQVRPREDWVILAKSEIFRSTVFESNKIANRWTYDNIIPTFRLFSRRKLLAISLAGFLFIIVGVFAFIKYSVPNSPSAANISQPSQENLVSIKHNVEDFKAKSKNLSDIAKFNSKDIALAVKEVKDAAKELTAAIQKDPRLAKTIALDINNNKTYLDISAGDKDSDLSQTLVDLYKATVSQLIKDSKQTTLTESEQKKWDYVESFYNKGNYTAALENALSGGKSDDSKDNK